MNAVVTGATKGIGRAIAVVLAKKGYHLSVCSRNEKELSLFVEELEALGTKAVGLATDCSDKLAVKRFCAFTAAKLGAVDVLVNNAGTFLPGSLLDEDDESFENQLSLNLNSAYYCSKFFGKSMRERQSGHIFNICSVAGKTPVKNAGSYSVTKSAMLSLNYVLRQELAQYNVKVTAILPGSTFTASWEGTDIPQERFVQPDDIAQTLHSILNLSYGVNVDEVILKPQNFNL